MSDETKPTPEKLRELRLEEFREQWPKSDDGRLCARLLHRYMVTLMVHTAAANICLEVRAQAESGADKAYAKLILDFQDLAMPTPEKPKPTPMQTLHRFQPESPETEKP